MIKFLEPRDLVGYGPVAEGDERTFTPELEAAYVANGIAVFVDPTPATGKTKKEVADNG